MSLNRKIAIVTGAASGIGKEIARRFVAEGAAIADRHSTPQSAPLLRWPSFPCSRSSQPCASSVT